MWSSAYFPYSQAMSIAMGLYEPRSKEGPLEQEIGYSAVEKIFGDREKVGNHQP
jgi:hypothetical protein